MNSGDYGPFTLVIESEDGKKVEDIIVNLSYIHTGGHSKSSSYSQTQVVSTGEAITFPRGYVSSTNDSAIGMYVGISHLDYQQISLQMVDINTEKKEQVIDLGIAKIKAKKNDVDETNKMWMDRGFNYKQAERQRKIGRLYTINSHYFVKALRIGRLDLIDKYMTSRLKDIYDGDTNSLEAKKLEKELRYSMKKMAGY